MENNINEQNTDVLSQQVSAGKNLSSGKVLGLALAMVVILGIGAFFSISFLLKSSKSENNSSKSYNSKKEMTDNDLLSKQAEIVSRGYLEALSSGNYEKAYKFLNTEHTLATKEEWIKLNREVEYTVDTYSISDSFSVNEGDYKLVGDSKAYELNFDVKMKANFTNDSLTQSTLVLIVDKDNDYKIIDRGSFIKSKLINKTVSNVIDSDKVKADFTLKKVYFTRNLAYLTWDYVDGGPLKNGNLMISPYKNPILTDANSGNTIKFVTGKINSKEQFSQFDRKSALVSKNNYSLFKLEDYSSAKLSNTPKFFELNLKFLTPITSSSLSGKQFFPEFAIN